MSFITDLFSNTTGGVVKSIGDVVDKFVTTKEEKMQAELEIKKAEQQYQIEMRKMGIEEQGLYLEDTQNARKRETDIAISRDAPWFIKIVGPLLAIITTVLTFGLFYVLIFRNDVFYIPDPNDSKKLILDQSKKDIIIYILGVLSAVVTQIFSYYFGSSQGSADKSKQIDEFRIDAAKAATNK
jgi:hypothetical protein